MKPSDFAKSSPSCGFGKAEPEWVAQRIMTVLARTGDVFREMTKEEYLRERKKDGNSTFLDERYFEFAWPHCSNLVAAKKLWMVRENSGEEGEL